MAKHSARDSRTPFAGDARTTDDRTLRQPDEVDALFAAAYQDLRKLARLRLRGGGRNAVLDTTSLVHESYLRLAQAGQLRVGDRTHFLRYASCAMRSVIVDLVRQRQ